MWTVIQYSYDQDYNPMFLHPMISNVIGVVKDKKSIEIIMIGMKKELHMVIGFQTNN